MKKEGKKNGSIFFDKEYIIASFPRKKFEIPNSKQELIMYLLCCYLRFYSTSFGTVCLTLNTISSKCGNYTKGNSKETNEKFREALIYLKQQGAIDSNKDISMLKNTEYFEIKIINESIISCNKSGFVWINMNEFETLVNGHTTTKPYILLFTYLYLKKNIYIDKKTGAMKLSIPSNEEIKKIIGVSSTTTIQTVINNLKELGLIYCNEITYYYKDNKSDIYKPTRKIYGLNKNDLVYSRENLKEFYQTDHIYTIDEIDKTKIFYSKIITNNT